MKILFVLNKGARTDNYVIQFTKELAVFLARKHQIGIVSDTNLFPSTISLYALKTIDFTWWDVVIVQDLMTLDNVHTAIQKSTPILFISHNDAWEAQPFVCKNLLKVFYTSRIRRHKSIPTEMVGYINKPIFTEGASTNNENESKSDVNNKINTIHFHQQSDCDLAIIKTVIAFANSNPRMNLTIVAGTEVMLILETLKNNNVTLIEVDKFSQSISDFDLAITSDYYALKSLYLGVPTIIVGNRGFGGLLSTQNVADHLKWHFSGRIGGELNEMIPYWVLLEEFQNLQAAYSAITDDTKKVSLTIKNQYDPYRVFTILENEIAVAYNLYKSLLSEDYYMLKPKLVKEIRIINSKSKDVFHIVNETNKVLGMISQAENEILYQFKGEKTIRDIANEVGIEDSDIRDFIRELWNEKIICFSI